MKQWWQMNGGLLIAGETPESLAVENSVREHTAAAARSEFLREFGSSVLAHMDPATLRMFRDGPYLVELRKLYT